MRIFSFFVILICLLVSVVALAQERAEISAEKTTHDFGQIPESDGLASHTFTIKNSGNSPLVITRVTVSCGCTTPAWTKEPIAPGNTGDVIITFNPKGRPGPFHKTASVYSNGQKGALRLNISGNVTARPATPTVTYPYSIGTLKLETKKVSYNSVRPDETVGEKIRIRNDGENPLFIKKGRLPNYLTVDIQPESILPGETGEIYILLNAEAAKRKGRIVHTLPLTIEGNEKKGEQGSIMIAANIIDNFTKLSSSGKANAPVAQLSATGLDFGRVESKGGILPVIGGKTSENLTITNTGKNPLSIYSVSCDNDVVDISGGKKELKPGTSATYKITLRPKEIKSRLDTYIYVVTNDPSGPVRMIKVTAEK